MSPERSSWRRRRAECSGLSKVRYRTFACRVCDRLRAGIAALAFVGDSLFEWLFVKASAERRGLSFQLRDSANRSQASMFVM